MTVQELFKIQVLHGFIFQIFLGECLFIPALKRRKHFWWRFCGGTVACVLVSYILVNIVMYYVSGVTSLIVFLLSIGLYYLCFEEKFSSILFCCIGAQLIQNLSHNLENLIYLPLSEYIPDVGWFFLSVFVMAVVYAGAYFIIVRRVVKREEINIGNTGVFIMAIVAAVFCFLMQFLFQYYEIDKLWATRLPLLLCCVLALFLQFGILTYKKKEEENLLLESYVAQGNTLYETLKTSVDIIVSAMSKNKTLHNYYKCVGVTKHTCDKRTIRKQYLEDEVITAITGDGTERNKYGVLTDEFIDMVAAETYTLIQAARNDSEIKRLENIIEDNKKAIDNLMQALMHGKATDIILSQVERLENENKELADTVAMEKAMQMKYSYSDIRKWLLHFRTLDYTKTKHRKELINIFIYRIVLYNDKMKVLFHLKGGQKEELLLNLIFPDYPDGNEDENEKSAKEKETENSVSLSGCSYTPRLFIMREKDYFE